MAREFQVITINPNLIDFEQGVKYVQHMQEAYPEYTIVGMLDGMTLVTLDEEEMKLVRDALTEIIGDKKDFISKKTIDSFFKSLTAIGNSRMRNSDQIYGYETALTDAKRMIDSFLDN